MTDLISRAAVREAMYHEAMEKDSDDQRWDGGCWIRYRLFERVIDSIPSAQKRGKWIEYPEVLKFADALDDSYIACSCCGNVFSVIDNETERFNFCPNCGAKMEGDVDGSD